MLLLFASALKLKLLEFLLYWSDSTQTNTYISTNYTIEMSIWLGLGWMGVADEYFLDTMIQALYLFTNFSFARLKKIHFIRLGINNSFLHSIVAGGEVSKVCKVKEGSIVNRNQAIERKGDCWSSGSLAKGSHSKGI